MKRITFAVAMTLILGALTFALPKLKSDVKANPVAKPAAAQIGPDACKWKSNKAGANWSDTIVSTIKTVPLSEQVCTENKYYGGSEWKIGVQ